MALSVPLSRFTSQVGGGSAFFVRPHSHHEVFDFHRGFTRPVFGVQVWISLHAKHIVVFTGHSHSDSGIAIFGREEAQDYGSSDSLFSMHLDWRDYSWLFDRPVHHSVFQSFSMTTMWPNKSPEPTAVGACSSAVAVHVASRRWLSFFR